jgi:hypothetical protein
LDVGTEAVIKLEVLVDGACPYINVWLHDLERVLKPIKVTSTQALDRPFRLSA